MREQEAEQEGKCLLLASLVDSEESGMLQIKSQVQHKCTQERKRQDKYSNISVIGNGASRAHSRIVYVCICSKMCKKLVSTNYSNMSCVDSSNTHSCCICYAYCILYGHVRKMLEKPPSQQYFLIFQMLISSSPNCLHPRLLKQVHIQSPTI